MLEINCIENTICHAARTIVGETGKNLARAFFSPYLSYSAVGLALFGITIWALRLLGRAEDYRYDVSRQPKRSAIEAAFPPEIIFSRSMWRDIQLMFTNHVLVAIAAVMLIPGLHYGFNLGQSITRLLGKSSIPLSNGLLADLAFSFCNFVALDFALFICHYAFHKSKLLWEFHKVHHSAVVLTPFTIHRIHIVESIANIILVGIALTCSSAAFYYLFETRPSVVSLFGAPLFHLLIHLPCTVLAHSHIWWSFGKLERYFMSPAMHIYHHSVDPRHFDVNFGLHFSIFDRLFGTLLIAGERPQAAVILGTEDDFDWDKGSLLAVLWQPFRKGIQIMSARLNSRRTTNLTDTS